MFSVPVADVALLIHREAELLDGNQFSDWLNLYAKDAVYQIPARYLPEPDDTLGLQTILLDRGRLQDYVRRMSSGNAVVANPPPRTVRLLSMPLPSGENQYSVAWNLHVVRNDESAVFAGRTMYEVILEEDVLKIRRKTVRVANDTFPTGYMPLI